MRFITGEDELKKVKYFMQQAAEEAKKSRCKKSQRGVVIELNGKIIGRGHNKPTLEHLCCLREHIKDNSRVELCTAVHAEQMAIVDAANMGKSISCARMYHIKLKDGEMRTSGNPSCTVCSRIIGVSWISEFVLWHKEGYALYSIGEFNELSFDYFLK